MYVGHWFENRDWRIYLLLPTTFWGEGRVVSTRERDGIGRLVERCFVCSFVTGLAGLVGMVRM